jgi:hypothetical protein
MKRAAAALCVAVLAAGAGRCHGAIPDLCTAEAAAAERAAGIPAGLLLAIGKRESGRWESGSGRIMPWPWSINSDGDSHVFESRDEAVAFVAAAQRGGAASIDVGCFQVNLKYHPHAFASLEDAFDPAANAAYAARFLTELHDREGSWEQAVADYHSATPVYGEPYRDAVLALWRGFDTSSAKLPLGGGRVAANIPVWSPHAAPSAALPAAGQVAAVTPAAVPPATIEVVRMIAPRRVHGLPQVITPLTPVAVR